VCPRSARVPRLGVHFLNIAATHASRAAQANDPYAQLSGCSFDTKHHSLAIMTRAPVCFWLRTYGPVDGACSDRGPERADLSVQLLRDLRAGLSGRHGVDVSAAIADGGFEDRAVEASAARTVALRPRKRVSMAESRVLKCQATCNCGSFRGKCSMPIDIARPFRHRN